MAFGRNENVYVKDGEDIMSYSCSTKYMAIRLKEFFPNITENDVKDIVTDGMGVLDSFVLDGIADEYKSRQQD